MTAKKTPTAEIFARLNEIWEQGRNNASKLELIESKLFGSEEDHFEAGRLPILERRMEDNSTRILTLETDNAHRSGQRTIMQWVINGAGKALLAAGSALAGALFGGHLHK